MINTLSNIGVAGGRREEEEVESKLVELTFVIRAISGFPIETEFCRVAELDSSSPNREASSRRMYSYVDVFIPFPDLI